MSGTGRGHVVVIGGGLAGIAAAIELRDQGTEVTLLEARGWLGGATCSFSRDGLAIDNGQHVFLRCCTQYLWLLDRLGMTGSVTMQDRFDITVLSPRGAARLRRSGLPAPLHLAGALARYAHLSPADRLRVGRAVLAMRFASPADPRLDAERLGDWLAARWQREQARRRLWDLFIVSTLNTPGDEASVALAAKVIRTALLESASAADIGVPDIPLGQLHGAAALALLGQIGADVRLGVKVVAIAPAAGGGFDVHAAARTLEDRPSLGGDDPDLAGKPELPDATAGPRYASGATALRADGVVVAVPVWDAARLVPAQVTADWAGLNPSPIVNVHVVYDRQVTRLPFAAAVDSPVQWVFDKTRQAGVHDGQYLVVSQSAADGYIGTPAAALREQFLPALCELIPAAREAEVRDFFVTRERRATFRQAPGCGGLRPAAATPLSKLVLAGAWTDTGWPDTMEGAVRSGQTAAREMQRQLGRPAGQAGRGQQGSTAERTSARTTS
jgi:monoamine oxidase